MKPNFALNLSHDGIGLLHRKKGSKNGWTLVGEVAIDDSKMTEKLEMLRKTAADLEVGGLATKLLIPNSQILYTEIDAPGPDDIKREVQIREGLKGLTPYNVSELVFDWRKADGTKVKVAVLARETLNEAESFAKEHRLNPVSFVARPSAKGFKGEAFFGKTASAAALLGPGEQIERDRGPVPRLENLRPKSPDAPIETKPAKAPPKKPEAETPKSGQPQADPKPSSKPDPKPTPEAKPVAQAKPAPKPEPKITRTTRLDPTAEDARVAALLADVPEPSNVAPAAKPITADVTAPLPGTAQTIQDKAQIPILAPFPPTPEVAEEDTRGRMPPPPPRRKLPDTMHRSPAKAASIEGSGLTPADAQTPRPPIPVKRLVPTAPSPTAPSPTPPSPTPPSRAAQSPAGSPLQQEPASFSSRRGPALSPALNPELSADSGTAVLKPAPSKPALGTGSPEASAQTAPPPPLTSAAATMPARDAASHSAKSKPASKPKLPSAATSSITSPVLAGGERPTRSAKTAKTSTIKNGLLGRASQGAQGLLSRTKSAKAGFSSQRVKSSTAKGNAAPAPVKPTAKPAIATNIAPIPKNFAAMTPQKPAPRAEIKPLVGAPKTQSDDVKREVDRMTMFGARKSQKATVGGKHKYLGLFLTLALLLVMAIVAMASVFFFSDETGFFDQTPEENPFAVAAIPDITLVPPSAGTLPDTLASTEPPPLAGTDTAALQMPGDPAGLEELPLDFEPEPIEIPPTAVPDSTPPALATLPPLTGVPQILSADAAEAQYATSGIWQKAPIAPAEPQGSRIDDLYIASIDPAISSQDAVALPTEATRSQEARPASPLPPPAAGTSFALNTEGLVTPTPEGTLSPDGVLIFSGRPEFVAPLRPGIVAPEITAPDILQQIRPKPRPEGLIEDNERANLGGITRAEMASLRPTSRPVSLQAEAAEGDGAPNDLATATSPSPGYRPGDFATIVTASLERAATRASASDGSSVSSAPSSPTTGPVIPTRASVARQATIDNAIRLNELNLIGIFGSSSSRRALVRLKNGDYVKVSVGDRLNGGRVLSITENRLIYSKSSRNHTLDMLPLG